MRARMWPTIEVDSTPCNEQAAVPEAGYCITVWVTGASVPSGTPMRLIRVGIHPVIPIRYGNTGEQEGGRAPHSAWPPHPTRFRAPPIQSPLCAGGEAVLLRFAHRGGTQTPVCRPCAQSGGWGTASGLWRAPRFACPHGAYTGEGRRAPVSERPPVRALPLCEPEGEGGVSRGLGGGGCRCRAASRSRVALAREPGGRGGALRHAPRRIHGGWPRFRVPVASRSRVTPTPEPGSTPSLPCGPPERRRGRGEEGPGEGGAAPLLGLRAWPAAHVSPEGEGVQWEGGEPLPVLATPSQSPPSFSAPPRSVKVANRERGVRGKSRGRGAQEARAAWQWGRGVLEGGREWRPGKRVPPAARGQQGTRKGGHAGEGGGGRGRTGGGWGRGHKRRSGEGRQGGGREGRANGRGAHRWGRAATRGRGTRTPFAASRSCTLLARKGEGGSADGAWKRRGWDVETGGGANREREYSHASDAIHYTETRCLHFIFEWLKIGQSGPDRGFFAKSQRLCLVVSNYVINKIPLLSPGRCEVSNPPHGEVNCAQITKGVHECCWRTRGPRDELH
ncbi:hypothetical protein BJY52DRAFT_1224785 [Lactarius psammicola]|nr:hypothetical protein BJY52DRAFT_1224785 [Lactarius psammicola]